MKICFTFLLLLIVASTMGQSVVINKVYNTGTADASGDGVELLIVEDSLDMRGMIVKDFNNNTSDDAGKYTFSNNGCWASVRAGTLIVLMRGTVTSGEDSLTGGEDFNLTVSLDNPSFFSSTGVFNITNVDMVMIKSAGSGVSGVTGSIHALYYGNSTPTTLCNSVAVPKLRALTVGAVNQFVYAQNSNSKLSDYNSTLAVTSSASTNPAIIFGQPNTVYNTTYCNSLRIGKALGSAPSLADYDMLFEDDFLTATGKADTLHWWSRKETYKIFGGINAAENVVVDSFLRIKYTMADTNYVGGGIISKHNFGFGYYELRAKLYGATGGLHQSFWSFGTNGAAASQDNSYVRNDLIPSNNTLLEIDGFEVDSRTYTVYNPSFIKHKPVKTVHHESPVTGFPTTQWFKAGFEWFPDRINYYINDSLKRIYMLPDSLRNYAPQNIWISALPTPVGYYDSSYVPETPLSDAAMLVDYFKYYARKNTQNVNIAGNGSFEDDVQLHRPLSWINVRKYSINGSEKIFDTSATKLSSSGSHSGNYCIRHYSANAYKTSTRQILEYIPNGIYKVSVWTKRSGNQNEVALNAKTGGNIYTASIPVASVWTLVELDSISVQDNKLVIECYSDAQAGDELYIDDVSVIQTDTLSSQIITLQKL